MEQKICLSCQQAFIPHNNFQSYCNQECTKRARRARRKVIGPYLRTCPVCKVEFRSENKDAIYCSSKCFAATTKRAKSRKGKPKSCAHCGVEFQGYKHNSYCSKACAYKGQRKRVTVTCLNCDQSFEARTSQASRKKYCSRACRAAHIADRLDLTCQNCGKSFRVQRWYAENGRLYCTKQCFAASLLNRIACACATCGNPIERTPSQAEHGKKNYCSVACYSVGKKKEWNDEQLRILCRNRRRYSYYWAKLAAGIRKRDNYTCRLCGTIQRKPSLHVHHINPLSNYTLATLDEANKSENLTCLCGSCHRKVEVNPALLFPYATDPLVQATFSFLTIPPIH